MREQIRAPPTDRFARSVELIVRFILPYDYSTLKGGDHGKVKHASRSYVVRIGRDTPGCHTGRSRSTGRIHNERSH